MNFLFKSEIIDYEFSYGKEKTVLFLHGWGADKNAFASTENLLKSKFNILTLTMPTIKETTCVWTLQDYATLVLNLLNLHNIKSCYIVCHSFGFRVASLVCKSFYVEKIVVTGGAGLKLCNPFKEIENNNKKIFLNKWKFLYNTIASEDYKNLSQTNKQTFKNIVNLNTKNLVSFNCYMLLFWGNKDKETPPSFAKIIKKYNTCKIVMTKGAHFSYLKNNALFNNEVNEFLC